MDRRSFSEAPDGERAHVTFNVHIRFVKRLRDSLPDYVGFTQVTVIAAPVAREILKPTKDNPLALPYVPTREQLRQLRDNSHHLLQPGAIELFLAKPEWARRGWRPETIRSLALDGHLGVNGDATTFHYASCCTCIQLTPVQEGF